MRRLNFALVFFFRSLYPLKISLQNFEKKICIGEWALEDDPSEFTFCVRLFLLNLRLLF